MPTVLQQDGFRVQIYDGDHDPPHVHVFKAGETVKIEIAGLQATDNFLSKQNFKKALALVYRHQDFLMSEWRRING